MFDWYLNTSLLTLMNKVGLDKLSVWFCFYVGALFFFLAFFIDEL